jgi:hypothetical protein
MNKSEVARLLARQEGVISRAQLVGLGGTDADIRRLVRRRQWARVHQGVYVEHTGPLSWKQRAWAAVLYAEPAALAGSSALDAHGLRGHHRPDRAIRICIDESRFVRAPTGLVIGRTKDFSVRCQLNLSPPRMRIEHALLTEAGRSPRPDKALAILADAVQQGRTTPARLDSILEQHSRLPHRALLREILDDVAAGAYSVLERRYLVDVERPHALPIGDRQRRVRLGRTAAYRDVDYVELATTIELDGRIGHEDSTDRWADLGRDLEASVAGDLTLRAGWKQVLEPCRMASIVGSVLTARGWAAEARPCGPTCAINLSDAA